MKIKVLKMTNIFMKYQPTFYLKKVVKFHITIVKYLVGNTHTHTQ